MIGVGAIELAVGLLLAALLVYYSFRDRGLVALLVLLFMLSPNPGLFVAFGVAYLRYALFGG